MKKSPGVWPFEHDGLQCGHQEFCVGYIGSGYDDRDRNAVRVAEDGAFGSQLAPICRIGPGFFPHPAEPWSSNRRYFAISSQFLRLDRIELPLLSTPDRICPNSPIVESAHERSIPAPNLDSRERPSTGCPFSKYRKSCAGLFSDLHVAGRRVDEAGAEVASAELISKDVQAVATSELHAFP